MITIFTVQVTLSSGEQWDLRKRYNHFKELQKELAPHVDGIVLPPKDPGEQTPEKLVCLGNHAALLRCSPQENRRKKLDSYIHEVCDRPTLDETSQQIVQVC